MCLQEIIDKISKLSMSERQRLIQWQEIMDWRPENKTLTKKEQISFSKKLLLGINKKSVGTKKVHRQVVIK